MDYSGNEVQINGMGMIPYYMWNVTGGMYSNVYYGASFVDYVGYVENKLLLVRPENGQGYDSFVMNQYFNLTIDGPTAPDAITMAAIRAIRAIPAKVTYADKALVEAARAAYNKIATVAQQALVTNYADLVTAEQRILALTPVEEPAAEEPQGSVLPVVLTISAIVVVCALAALAVVYRKQLAVAIEKWLQARKKPAQADEGENNETEN